jgi:hypothetical protein
MATLKHSPRGKLSGQKAIAHSLDQVVQETFRLWRKHHLGYDQSKYVVERVRRRHGRDARCGRPRRTQGERISTLAWGWWTDGESSDEGGES